VQRLQKCIRTNDIENVGRTARHHTFFCSEISALGLFQRTSDRVGWELSTSFGLPPEQLVVSVFETTKHLRSGEIRLAFQKRELSVWKDDNLGIWPHCPCGPCSEIYYDFHPERGDENIDLEDTPRSSNLVFMQYNRDSEGNLTPLRTRTLTPAWGWNGWRKSSRAFPTTTKLT